MYKIIREPLHPKYEIIQLRVTQLESFIECAYKQKYETSQMNYEALIFGDQAHSIIQHYMFNKDSKIKLVDHFKNEAIDMGKLYSFLQLIDTLNLPDPIISENKMQMLIEYWEYLIALSWTIDMICEWNHLLDFKTSASKWGQEDSQYKTQWKLYPWMYNKIRNLQAETINFSYIVLTKQVTPQIQVFTHEANIEDCENYLKRWLLEYVLSIKTWVFKPTKCKSCLRCKLKPSCPLYTEDII